MQILADSVVYVVQYKKWGWVIWTNYFTFAS